MPERPLAGPEEGGDAESHAEAEGTDRTRAVLDLPRLALAAAIIVPLVVAAVWLVRREGGGVSRSGVQILDARMMPVEAAPGLQVEAAEGALAPDFEASNLDGVRLRLLDYRSQAVVLNFWATWCVSCLAEIPDLQRVQDEQSDKGLVVLGVNVGEDVGRAERFLREELGAQYESLMDPDMTVARKYRVPGLPVTVFIDSDGVIRRLIAGELDYDIFDRFARVALGERDVPGVDEPLPPRFLSPLPEETDSTSDR